MSKPPSSVANLSSAHQELAAELASPSSLNQSHLLQDWPPAGVDDDKKAASLEQLKQLDGSYPGGLAAYVSSARKLLASSQRGENPLSGWRPSVPEDGYDLEPGSAEYERYERAGLGQAGAVGFVVPAGGLGERLGYHGVKFALPSEVTSGACVLRVYCEYILAAQRTANAAVASPPPSSVELPLAIMVSSDTEAGIVALLEANDHFGLKPSQVTLLRQEKVAALMDSEARFAKAGEYEVVTKPHGHGDVHFLLHSTGTARRWHDELGIRWLHFFQDTNTLYFSNFLATVGVSATHGIAVNLVASPRKAKEAVGGVCRLTHEDGRTMVANVEYNQLEPLLVASGFADGDVNEPETGFSRFPGNINQIIISLPSWLETISSSGGAIAEFVNPKYTDGSRTAFKSPTRLECMMQDYVKTVPAHHRVAWTRYPLWLGYFPCKNDIVSAAKLSDAGVPPHSASTSEMAVYHHHAQQLRVLGASVGAPIERSFRGVKVAAGPSVVLAPSFAPCFTLLAEKVHGKGVSISARSSLVVRGEKVRIERLELDGALVIDVADGGSLTLRRCSVRNGGWELRELGDEEAAAADEENAIRGYVLHKGEQREIRVAAGEDVVIDEGGA